jgi:RNA polymerase sigma-70 factor (ECF subfamily)
MDRLFRAAYALAGSRHDAEDLVQETYARVLRRPRFIRRHGDLPYLLRALRNTWTSMWRAHESRGTVAAPPEDLELLEDPSGDPHGERLEANEVYSAISQLSPPLRDAIVAVDVVGLSYKEAARALQVRSGTVRSRLFRAREQVANQLEEASA